MLRSRLAGVLVAVALGCALAANALVYPFRLGSYFDQIWPASLVLFGLAGAALLAVLRSIPARLVPDARWTTPSARGRDEIRCDPFSFSVAELAAWRRILDWEICRGRWRLSCSLPPSSLPPPWLATQGLRLLHWLSAVPVGVLWGAVAATLVGLNLRRRRSRPALRIRLPDLDAQLAIVLASACPRPLGITALAAPPNTSDAMSYHLPRVMHWLQNRASPFRRTFSTRSRRHPVPSTWSSTCSSLGGDRLAPLVQWAAFVATARGLLASLLGGNRTGEVLGARVRHACRWRSCSPRGRRTTSSPLWLVCSPPSSWSSGPIRASSSPCSSGFRRARAPHQPHRVPVRTSVLLWFVSLIAARGGAGRLAVAAPASRAERGPLRPQLCDVRLATGPELRANLAGQCQIDEQPIPAAGARFEHGPQRGAPAGPPRDAAVRAVAQAVTTSTRFSESPKTSLRRRGRGRPSACRAGPNRCSRTRYRTRCPSPGAARVGDLLLVRRRGSAGRFSRTCGRAGRRAPLLPVLRWEPWNSRLQTPLFCPRRRSRARRPRYGARRGALGIGMLLLVALTPWLLLGQPSSVTGLTASSRSLAPLSTSRTRPF